MAPSCSHGARPAAGNFPNTSHYCSKDLMLREFFFRPPVFANPEKTRRAATLFALIWINTIAGALTLVGVMLTQLEIAPVAITNLFVLGTMAIALFALGHRGRINTAG